MYAHNMGRTERGFALTHPAGNHGGFHRGIFQLERPGDIEFPPERIAEAERRKAMAKQAELAKAGVMRR